MTLPIPQDRKAEPVPRRELVVVAVAITFVLNGAAAVFLRMGCDLTLGLTGFGRTVCDNVAGVGLLLVLGGPLVVSLAGTVARRLGTSFVFYAAWGGAIGAAFAVAAFI